MIGIGAKIIKDFEKVERAKARAERTALRRSGAYVRTVARNSIKKGKMVNGKREPSQPGTPPRYWVQSGQNFRNSIWYSADGPGRFVVGPVQGRQGQLGRLHEVGGSAVVTASIDGKKRMVTARYPARPFMRPALEKSKEKISTFWASTVR